MLVFHVRNRGDKVKFQRTNRHRPRSLDLMIPAFTHLCADHHGRCRRSLPVRWKLSFSRGLLENNHGYTGGDSSSRRDTVTSSFHREMSGNGDRSEEREGKTPKVADGESWLRTGRADKMARQVHGGEGGRYRKSDCLTFKINVDGANSKRSIK